MDKKEGKRKIEKKKKVKRACLFCQRSHMPCDEGRPCNRCIKRSVPHLCVDGNRKQAKYLRDPSPLPSSSNVNSIQTPMSDSPTSDESYNQTDVYQTIFPSNSNSNPNSSPTSTSTTSTQFFPSHSSQPQPHLHHSHPHSYSQPQPHSHSHSVELSSQLPPIFSSEAFNQEFSSLSNMVSSSSIPGTELRESESQEFCQKSLNLIKTHRKQTLFEDPTLSDSIAEPFPYHKSFHQLLEYFKGRMKKEQLLRICQAIFSFRPSVAAAIRNLTRNDLIFVEKCFQRTVIEFSKILCDIGTPTCIWRRSGEIAFVGQEFSTLTGWSEEQLVTKTFIFELMDNESAVDYWEKYATMFRSNKFDCYGKVTLRRPNAKPLHCSVCYTLKRDIYDIPLCIVGSFLPILN